MKNKVDDLRNHLFETIEMLKSGDMDTKTAKEISSAAQVIVNSAKVEVEYIDKVGGYGTGFMPIENNKPTLKQIK